MSQRDLIWLTHCSIRSYEYRAVGFLIRQLDISPAHIKQAAVQI